MENKYDILFAVIAMREVKFFANIGKELQENGKTVAFLTFYEPGDNYLEKQGFKVFSLHKEVKNHERVLSEDIIRKYQNEFKIDNIRANLVHERVTFNRYDENKLISKYINYLDYFKKIFNENHIGVIIQELGGFIAPLALFNSAIAFNVNHIFIEPAMYKGRIFFNLNTLDADLFKDIHPEEETITFVKEYIEKYYSEKTIVVPSKDKHLFNDMSIKKLVNVRNLTKLWFKIYNKYVRRETEEYNAIFNHVWRAVKMYFNRKSVGKLYSNFNADRKYVYFPFHVPLDIQLTIRSREYINQLNIVSLIADMLPYGMELYTKEHPAGIGAYKSRDLKEVLKNGNVKLIKPTTNSADIIKNAEFIITINSKVGAEALMQNKKVIVLGDVYYKGYGNTIDITNFKELKKVLSELLDKQDFVLETEKLNNFFYKVYQSSYQGELYLNTKENIEIFYNSMINYLKERNL